MQTTGLPLWLDANYLEATASITKDKTMLYSIALPKGWQKNIAATVTGAYPEHIFNGAGQADWLVISYMDKAVAGHNMEGWVNHILSATGFPCAQMAGLNPAPVLVTWKQQPVYDAYLQKLQCEEMLAWCGSALVGENERSRLFMLMLRRQNFAWKIFLSIASNWGNNDDEVACLLQDNVNASQVFGSLQAGIIS